MPRWIPVLAAVLAAVVGSSGSDADAAATYSFSGITHNNKNHTAIGERQFSMTVADAGGGFVEFKFTNSGSKASSITDIYFDDSVDPSLFTTSISAIDDSDSGVSFSEGSYPRDLPGGDAVGFEASRGLTTDADWPTGYYGINPGESLGMTLELVNGHEFNDVITALADSSLRVGVQGKAFGRKWWRRSGKESFVNNPGSPPAVPEPGSLAVFGLGLAAAGFRFRRRRQSAPAEQS